MEQNVNVLRFIIIKTVREDTKIVERPRSVMGKEYSPKTTEKSVPISEVELDKAIEELGVE